MKRVLLLCVFWAFAAQAQELASLGDFPVDGGGIIRDCKIGFRTYGKIKPDRSNVIVVTTWFGGTSASLAGSIGPGKMYDPSKYFIVVIDALGDGVSSSPSNTADFPRITIRDMVRSQHQLLTRELELQHVYAIAGSSMGGMQVLEWMATYPDFMDKAIAVTATPKQTSHDLLLWKTQLALIDAEGQRAMRFIAHINSMALSTPSYVAAHTAPDAIDASMRAREELLKDKNVNDYAAQLRAVMDQDIYRRTPPETLVKSFRAKLLVVVSEQDHMVNPAPARELAQIAKAQLVTLTGDCGHLASACEMETVTKAVVLFLECGGKATAF